MSISVKAKASITQAHTAKIEKVIVIESDAVLDIIAESLQKASEFSDEAELWAIGEIADLPAGSAKYWAMQTQSYAQTAENAAKNAENFANQSQMSAESSALSANNAQIVVNEVANNIIKLNEILTNHRDDTGNPHGVTAEQLGLSTVYIFKGSVTTYADLPATGQKIGDVYNIENADSIHSIAAGDNVAWEGGNWEKLGGSIDLTPLEAKIAAVKVTADNALPKTGTADSSHMWKPSTNEVIFDLADFTSDNIYFGYRGLEDKANAINTYIFWNGKRGGVNGALAEVRAKNFLGGLSGNATSATKLQTPRTINGTPFDGSANIDIGKIVPLRISTNTDLNLLTHPGMYFSDSNATAATLLNCPTTNAFSLLVEHHAGTKQTITDYVTTNSRTFTRNQYNNTWGAWKVVMDDDSIIPKLAAKQDKLTAGTGIEIANNIISATGGGGGYSPFNAEGHLVFPNGTEFWIE